MTWLIAFLVAHAIEIGAIGATLYAANQALDLGITAEKVIKGEEKK